MPLSNEQLDELAKPIRNLKIICGTMLAGVCLAGIVICTIIDLGNLNVLLKMLVAMAAATGAVMYSAALVAFKVLSTQTHSRSEEPASHLKVLQSAWIVRFAVINGACFMNFIVTLLEHSLITLFVALVGVLLMVVGFPRSVKVESLLEDRISS